MCCFAYRNTEQTYGSIAFVINADEYGDSHYAVQYMTSGYAELSVNTGQHGQKANR